jgi:hypothetical protein
MHKSEGAPASANFAEHPIILYECQNKGLTKFAFRKWLILKDAILVVFDQQRLQWSVEKENAGASSRTPRAVTYKSKYSMA